MELIEVPLHAVAHSRAGDKGNRGNMSLMPYDPALYPLLAEQVTEARVLALFAHRGATRCVRYDLPLMHAFNFVIDDVLEGGGERLAEPGWAWQEPVLQAAWPDRAGAAVGRRSRLITGNGIPPWATFASPTSPSIW